MKTTRRSSYDASFKLKAIELAIQEENTATARKLSVNESMVRRWRQQREELMQCQKSRKAFRGHKSRWPEFENVLEDWVNTQSRWPRCIHCTDPTESQNNLQQN